MCENDEILQGIFKNISLYKTTSLCLPTDRSMPIIVMLTEQIQDIYCLLTKRQQIKLDGMLGLMMTALQNQDFVLVRDILVYDIYNFFMSIKTKK